MQNNMPFQDSSSNSNGVYQSGGSSCSPVEGGNGVWKGGRSTEHSMALQQIRQSLQPYQQSPTHSIESSMLEELVNMGFDKENSWYALKLTAFRSIAAAVEILLKANHYQGVVRECGSSIGDSCSSRSDSPSATPIAQPQRTPSPFLNIKRSAVSLHLQPSPSTQSLNGYAVEQSTPPVVQAVRSRRVEKPSPHSATVINVSNCVADPSCSIRPPTQLMSAKFDRHSVSTVQINVAPGQSQDGACINYKFETKPRRPGETLAQPGTQAGVQRITIDDGAPVLNPYNACDKSYIEELCKRVSSLLSQQKVLAKRDSTASSAGSECSTSYLSPSPNQNIPPPFSTLMHGRTSPVSSLSTESSNEGQLLLSPEEGPVRSISPLPNCVRCKVDNGESAIKPCTAKAFKFFMELHVENVIKQYEERDTRVRQLEREMNRATFEESWMCQMRRLLADKESRYLRLRRQRMDKSMFDTLTKIGAGAFAEVFLVRKKDTEALYAMKTLRKTDVIKRKQAAHVKAERDILSEADNAWVVKLYYSFQDKEDLFFIMEYIPGGDMMNLLMRKSIFNESLARFYIAELVCAIESVHKLGFIHRDIKPDNILIDEKGHIKLTDFGLCTGLRWTHDNKYYQHEPGRATGHDREDSLDIMRQAMVSDQQHQGVLSLRKGKQRQKAHSLVGTPNYIAPEVLMLTGHTQLCDWWSVGVILYEMVVGRPPFYSDRGPQDTQLKVIRWRDTLFIPENAGEHRQGLEPHTKDLILRLCCASPDRLGQTGAQDIKNHSYFKSINFANLRSSRAPFIPEIRHSTDTSNFEPMEEESESGAPSLKGAEPHPAQDHAFYEFTFRRFFDSDPMGCPTLRRTPPRAPLTPLIERHSNAQLERQTNAGADNGESRRNVSIICVNNASSPSPSLCV